MIEWIPTEKGPWPAGIIHPEVLTNWYMEEPLDAIRQCLTQSVMDLIRITYQQDQKNQQMRAELTKLWKNGDGVHYDEELFKELTWEPEEDLEELTKEKSELEQQLKQLHTKIDKQLTRTKLICDSCQKQFEINELIWIQTHWYEHPRGCTEGDTWHEGEGQWKCPECDHKHRLYNKPEISKLRRYFKSEEKVYER